MTTTKLIRPLVGPYGVDPASPRDASHAAGQASDPPFRARSSVLGHQAHDEAHGALDPLIGAVPGEGPPIILLAGPLVLFALALTGPFLLLATLAALFVACAVLVALAGAIVASPYLLLRRFGRRPLPRAPRRAPVAQFIPVDSGRRPA